MKSCLEFGLLLFSYGFSGVSVNCYPGCVDSLPWWCISLRDSTRFVLLNAPPSRDRQLIVDCAMPSS